MSMLLFYVGENSYAVDSRYILRVVPYVTLTKISFMPIYIPGFLNLEQKMIPIVDFCQFIEKRETNSSLLSRIILIQDPQLSSTCIVGIVGERVKDLLNIQIEEFKEVNFPRIPFPYLNRIFNDGTKIIQYLDIQEFLHFLSADLLDFMEKESHG